MLGDLEALSISEWIATSSWGYPIFLSIHSIGMAIVVGILAMLDVRILGAAQRLPISTFERLVPFAWAGFLLNLVSGTLLFMSLATQLVSNWPFLSKLAAILIAGLISWLLWRSVRIDLSRGQDEELIAASDAGHADLQARTTTFSTRSKLLAVLSLASWFAAILFGRLIAYVLDAAMLAGDF